MSYTVHSEKTGNKIVFTTDACEKKEGSPSGRGKSFDELDKEAKKKYANKLDPQNPKNGEKLLDGLDTQSICGSALEMHIWRYHQAGDEMTQIQRKLARDRAGEWGCDKRAVLDESITACPNYSKLAHEGYASGMWYMSAVEIGVIIERLEAEAAEAAKDDDDDEDHYEDHHE